jgi:putative phosphoribosyl transferase
MDYSFNKEVVIPARTTELEGKLTIPTNAKGVVIFAHGSGSSRMSPRNQMVAHYLHASGFGTLLFDLLTREEDEHYPVRFDIDLLTKRLVIATEWLEQIVAARKLPIGYFGASTGAAAALQAAAFLPQIEAVVSRGGRPDLAMESLPKVESPVLLIVGGLDYEVLKLNQQAYIFLECEKKLEVVPGATHLFEEQGAMEQVCETAMKWFQKYFQTTHILK